MVLFFIGLGLGDERDVTLRGKEAIDSCEKLYLEAYTSILGVDKSKLEEFYKKPVITSDREDVESGCDPMLEEAKTKNIAFLVVGDPFGATTHTDLWMRAHTRGIKVEVIHNASIMNAIGCCGLQLYNYGQTVSIVFFQDNWRPDSFYDKIKMNADLGLHTLCLLDIKVKEQTPENLVRGNKIFEPPRFMTVNQCISQLLEVEEKRKEGVCTKSAFGVGVARVGQKDQRIVSGTLEELLDVDFGPPLHSFVLAGKMHEMEEEMVNTFRKPSNRNQ